MRRKGEARDVFEWAAIGLVAAAALYAFALCGLYTADLPISNGLVAAVDAGVVLAAFALAARGAPLAFWIAALAVAANAAILAIGTGGAVNAKAARDALAAIAFFALGRRYGDQNAAIVAAGLIAGIVALAGLFETFAPGSFTQWFKVLNFYHMRGMIDPAALEYMENGLFVSSLRGEGRFLLPMLGDRRISSIFLEPVSMGNFGVVLLALALSLPAWRRRAALWLGAAGVMAIVAADARFASACAALLVLARFLPLSAAPLALAAAPLVAIGGVFLAAMVFEPAGDDFPSRLAASGHTLGSLGFAEIAGVRPDAVNVVDSGYAYVLTAFGVVAAIALWLAFIAAPTPGRPSARFKLLFGIYACALLCVSGSSLFAIKTAALGWFVFGALTAEDARRAAPRVRKAFEARLEPAR